MQLVRIAYYCSFWRSSNLPAIHICFLEDAKSLAVTLGIYFDDEPAEKYLILNELSTSTIIQPKI
jgi:hypothetical protein